MTTYIPAITIPTAVFQNAAASILLPIALGTAVGIGTRREPKNSQDPPPEMKHRQLTAETNTMYHPAASNAQKTYHEMRQPPLRPPPWVFGPVWTTLYGLMGYAAHRVASVGLSPLTSAETGRTTRQSLTLYTVQLGLNLAWMPLFFVAKRPVVAAVDIVSLLATNGYLTYLWGSVDQVAGWCQVPYLLWLSFASYLCIGAGYLNDWDLTKETRREEQKK